METDEDLVARVEAVLQGLVERLGTAAPSARAVLPGERVIEARCTDLAVARRVRWSTAGVEPLAVDGGRTDIRLEADARTVVALGDGALSVVEAYASGRLRVEASFTDLLRLRAVL